jgi:hypothetical protein
MGCSADFDTARARVPSDGVATQELGATIVVTDRGDGSTDAFVYLKERERNVELVAPDLLQASVGEPLTTLDARFFETGSVRTVSYGARLGISRGPARVILARGSSLLESVVEMPLPFELSAESKHAFSRGSEDVVLRWTQAAAGDRMYWYAVGDCIEARGDTTVVDTGTLTIARSSWTHRAGKADTCDVTIHLRRSRNGTLAPGIGGGLIQGEQHRTVTLSSRP